MSEPPAAEPTPRVNPNEVARHTFEVARRGYDQQAVRAYLHELALVIDGLTRSEKMLREELARRPATAPSTSVFAPEPEALDDAALLERLGEETTRVLTSAREAAAEIRTKAESNASRIVEEAVAEAARTRSSVLEEADRRLQEARVEADNLLVAARNELAERTKQAEAAAAAIIAEGEAEAQVLREAGAAARSAADREAEEILEAARTEGRDMVAEAQVVRERVLKDLSAKRKKARHQIEQLNAGRERLLEAYEVVRTTIDTATHELEHSVEDAKRAADAAARRVASESDDELGDLEAAVADGDLGGLPIVVRRVTPAAEEPTDEVAAPAADPEPEPAPVVTPAPEPTPAPRSVVAPAAEAPEDPGGDFGPIDLPVTTVRSEQRAVRTPPVLDPVPVLPAAALRVPDPEPQPVEAPVAMAAPEPEPAPEPIVEDEPVVEAAPEPEVEALPEPEPVAPFTAVESFDEPSEPADVVLEPVGEPVEPKQARAAAVFARLHEVADDAASAPDGPPAAEPITGEVDAVLSVDEEAFRHRAEVLEPIEADLLRRLKRALADEQNEVLDVLRRERPTGMAALLPSSDDHLARWVDAATAGLAAAAAAGASFADGTAGSTKDLAAELATSLVLPLRDRIDRSFEASDGDLDTVADRVKALYREWKIQRLPEIGPSLVVAAYARGVFHGTNKGAKVRWVVDPSRGPCPDCDDNVLAGVVVKGEAFPTGNQHAPAHPGCHCLVLVHEDVLLTD